VRSLYICVNFGVARNPKIRNQSRPAKCNEVKMTKLMSKSELIQKIAGQLPDKLTQDDVKGMLDALADVGHAELRTTGAFLLPGFAKFVVVEKAATEAHDGINPFTKEKMMVAAKAASKSVRARPVKAAKDAVS
jgi:DNA-binding protein HU-beta